MKHTCGACTQCGASLHSDIQNTCRPDCLPRIILAGNPNCGKTSLFNATTGARQKVGNRPGVTVEEKEADLQYRGKTYRLIDLPGTYSLRGFSQDEAVAKDMLLSNRYDLIINVLDATCPERGLYLTLQLLALQVPTVIALNLSDIAERRGIEIDTKQLSALLGVPVLSVSARTGRGLDELLSVAAEVCSQSRTTRWKSTPLQKCIDIPDTAEAILTYVDTVLSQAVHRKPGSDNNTDRADALLLHPLWGTLFLLCVLAVTFFFTFSVGDFLKDLLVTAFSGLAEHGRALLSGASVPPWLISFLFDGALTGICGILSFLPNLFFLYVILACLEDSGYMARAAYLADDLMSRLSLSGKAVIPMMLGYGCTVPAVLATRTQENLALRQRTMLLLPFLSCSARLPVYLLLADTFFGPHAPIAAGSMYLIGTGMSVILGRCSAQCACGNVPPILIELPDFRMPDVRTVLRDLRQKLKEYLTKAGTTVFLASVAVWLLLHIGFSGPTEDISQSFAADLGRVLSPILSLCGLGQWQTGVALISGIAAKEVVVSSLFILYGINTDHSTTSSLHTALQSAGFTPITAYTLMLFVLLYIPCAATLSAIRRESGSRRFVWAVALITLVTAFTAATLFYQIGTLLMS